MKTFFATQAILEILSENGINLICSEDMTLRVTAEQEQEITSLLNSMGIESDWGFED